MRLNERRPTPPVPTVGALPWHPETYSDMVNLDPRQLPITYELYPEFDGWNFLYSVRIGDDEVNRHKVNQLLLDQYEKNPALGVLQYKGDPGLNIMVWEKVPSKESFQ